MVVSFMFTHMMNFSFKSIGLASLKNDAYVTFVGSFGAAVNAIVRLFAGLAYQKFGYLKVGLVIFTLEVVTASLYLWAANNKFTYFIATCAFEITYGGQLGMYPLLSDTLFKKKGAMYYAYLFSSFTLSLLISLNGYTYLTTTFGQGFAFGAVAVVTLTALPFILRIGRLDEECRKGGEISQALH